MTILCDCYIIISKHQRGTKLRNLNKTTILLVDDHTILKDGIRALLAFHDDIEIIGEASEGKEAIEKVKELNPDIVIMDITMPGMDGLEATRRIYKKNKNTKVLVLSQHDNREYVLSCIKAGASGYLPKRALGSELVSAIRAVNQCGSFLYPSAAKAVIEEYLQKPGGKDSYENLIPREREILKLIADGNTSREIAEILFLSLKTVLDHRSKIMEKLNLHNRTELIKYAMRKGLVKVGSLSR